MFSLDLGSLHPGKTKMTMEKPAFEDVSPILNIRCFSHCHVTFRHLETNTKFWTEHVLSVGLQGFSEFS